LCQCPAQIYEATFINFQPSFAFYTLYLTFAPSNYPKARMVSMHFFLLDVASSTPIHYLPIVLQLIIAVAFVAGGIATSQLLGPKRKTKDKLANFESGIKQVGNARQPVAVKYFITAILYVLFDVEIVFFYPYAVNLKQLGWQGFIAVLMFVGFFLCGFFYILKRGALNWED
jgi:NADH-quinone oxidoreductase subunit A